MKKFIKYFKKPAHKPQYWLTRFILLRVLAFVYFFAFISLATQVIPLIGEDGLLPADNYLDAVGSNFDSRWEAFSRLPTIFWLHISDGWLLFFSWLGVLISIVVLIGYANSIIMLLLWILYMSFVHIGQLWYGYGWEIQLLETGFLAIFFVPFLDLRPFPKTAPPALIIWLFRWLTFRIYFGAGLIKIRADECWRKLTCMFYHYQTQPIPNPLSPLLHFLPQWYHKIEVLWNHFIELIVPFFVFWPRILRLTAGILLLTFQVLLILSGNLSFLNWITIVPALVLFDDQFLKKVLPKSLVKKSEKAAKQAKAPSRAAEITVIVVFTILIVLSIPVVHNLLSKRQIMNTSFDQWSLVNTYGAFGSIGKERYELVLQGTADPIISEDTLWKEYEFKAKPTDVNRPLPIIAPYQPRIDWQIWFAAMSVPQREPWLVHLVWKLLHNDELALSLIAENPFPDQPPKFIRIEYYKYEFAKLSDEQVWNRTHVGTWLNPLSVDTPGLREYIAQRNWQSYN